MPEPSCRIRQRHDTSHGQESIMAKKKAVKRKGNARFKKITTRVKRGKKMVTTTMYVLKKGSKSRRGK